MNDFFTKSKNLVLQLKQCKVEKEYDQLILAIFSKPCPYYSVFVSTFHTRKLTILNWKMSTLNAFIESLTNEHDKIFQMGIIRSSKDQALFAGGPKVMNGKGKQKNQKPKYEPPKEKDQSDESSSSRRNKKKGKEKVLCSYCERGFHPERSCTGRTIDQMDILLEKNNITLSAGARNADYG